MEVGLAKRPGDVSASFGLRLFRDEWILAISDRRVNP